MTKEDENDDPAIGLLNEGENDEGEEIDPEDVKKNGWKFGWEINEGEKNPLPTWPDINEMINNIFGGPQVNELQTFITYLISWSCNSQHGHG